MNSDDVKRPQDSEFKYRGEGLAILPMCFWCNQRKSRLGGKMRGPFRKLFSCRDCEGARK